MSYPPTELDRFSAMMLRAARAEEVLRLLAERLGIEHLPDGDRLTLDIRGEAAVNVYQSVSAWRSGQ